MNKNDLSLIIVSCASYKDVLEVLVKKLEEISFFDIDFNKVFLATDNEADFNYKELNIDHVVTGVGWGERVRNALKLAETERCLIVLDDYIPTSAVKVDALEKIVNADQNFDCVYLSSVFKPTNGAEVSFIDGFMQIPDNTLYRVNSTVGIWKTKSLLQVLSDQDSPWEWEAFAGLGKSSHEMKFAAPAEEQFQVYPYSYMTGGAVYRGSWVYDALINSGFDDDFISDLSGRSVIKTLSASKRSLSWKIAFLKSGYHMVGVSFLKFIYRSLIIKLSK